jgi:hypothetical protein
MNYIEDVSDIVWYEAENTSGWKIPVLFGALKRYRYYFWTNQEVREINEEYRRDLIEYNRFPVRQLHLWRQKNKDIEVNSFFVDLSKDPKYLAYVISGIKHNQKALYDIVMMWCHYDWGAELETYEAISSDGSVSVKKKSKALSFFEEVRDYIDVNEYSIKRPPFDTNKSFFNSDCLVRDITEGEGFIKEAYSETSYDVFSEDDYVENSPKLVIRGTKLDFKPIEELNLSRESLDIIRNWLKGLEDMSWRTAINLLENYKFFVFEENYGKFLRELEKNTPLLNSLFETFALDFIVQLIKKYYYYTVALKVDIAKRRDEQQQVVIEFRKRFRSEFQLQQPENLCYFVDVISYFYKKGFYFLEKEAYREMNSVMRTIFNYTPVDWYCFDPLKCGEWFKNCVDPYKNCFVCSREKDLFMALRYIIETHLIFSSSLILDALEITCVEQDFKKAKKLIDKACRKYNKDINEGIRFF